MLRTKEALLVLATLEARKADSLGVSEKVGIGGIQIAQCALQGLGVDFRKPFILRFQFTLHQIGQVYVAERFPAFLVCRDFQVQCPIIDKTTTAEGFCNQNLLLFCRIYSILIGT